MKFKRQLALLADQFQALPKPAKPDMALDRAESDLRHIFKENVRDATVEWDNYSQEWSIVVKDSCRLPDPIPGSYSVRLCRNYPADTSPTELIEGGLTLRDELETLLVTFGRSIPPQS